MQQAIAGVTPPEVREATVAVVWPTIGATRLGRLVGSLAGLRPRWDRYLIFGKLAAAATIPLSLAVFAWQLLPFVCRRYRLSSQRVIVERGLTAIEERSIGLDEFDAINVVVLPGQTWLHCGELVFSSGGSERFRLSGASRPDVFRATCQEAQFALLAIRKVLQAQTAS